MSRLRWLGRLAAAGGLALLLVGATQAAEGTHHGLRAADERHRRPGHGRIPARRLRPRAARGLRSGRHLSSTHPAATQRDARHRAHAARRAAAGDRLGRSGRVTRCQRRHVHHHGRARGRHGARHEIGAASPISGDGQDIPRRPRAPRSARTPRRCCAASAVCAIATSNGRTRRSPTRARTPPKRPSPKAASMAWHQAPVGPRVRQRAHHQRERSASGSRPCQRHHHRPADEPAADASPPPLRPEHRVHPVHRSGSTACSSSSRTPTWRPASSVGSRIILAFIGFGSLPLNIGGLLLITLGIVLFVLELTVTSHGLLQSAASCVSCWAPPRSTPNRARRRRPTSASRCRSSLTMTVLTSLFMVPGRRSPRCGRAHAYCRRA